MKVPSFSDTLDFLFPETKVYISPWADYFKNEDRVKFKKLVKIFAGLCALAYVLHYHFVDIPQGKVPIEKWFYYRYGVAALCLMTLVAYQVFDIRKFLRIPYFSLCIFFCYLQGQTLIWHASTPYQYGFIIAFVMAWTLQKNIAYSCMAFMILIGVQYDAMFTANVPTPHIVSHTILFLVAVIFTRSSYKLEIEKFLSDMELQTSQKNNIQLSIQFSEQLLAFLPKLTGLRIKSMMSKKNMSIAKAIDTVLRPKMLPTACIYSDIRGYTKKSKSLEFISKSAFAEIQNLSLAIDSCYGIPRKIGDLMFAYFDSGDISENVLRASIASIKMYESNKAHNLQNPPENKIERRIILSVGTTVVGNLGTFESSIEITAMGPPVNLAARIDEMTKGELFSKNYTCGHIICTEEFGAVLSNMVPTLSINKLDLHSLGLKIRDFEDQQSVCFFEPSEAHLNILITALNEYTNDLAARTGLIQLESA